MLCLEFFRFLNCNLGIRIFKTISAFLGQQDSNLGLQIL